MKNLCLVSFIGVDKHTSFDDLLNFRSNKVVYEFGVLYSDSRNDSHTRYPGWEFSYRFLNWAKDNKVCRSLHLCGSSIDRYLVEDPHILELCDKANRIQLNINIAKHSDYKGLANKILRVASRYKQCIIIQNNETKEKFNEVFLGRMEATTQIPLSFLNDSSCGFGVEIEKIVPPSNEYFTGYAGGINPDNITKITDLIENNNASNAPYYIDMESGIRTNGYFSINKCLKIKKLIDTLS